MTLSYLVSTAGHAQHQNDRHPHDIRSILQLIEEGAAEFEEEKVVGFASVDKVGKWGCDRYSFGELLSLSDDLIRGLIDVGVPINEKDEDSVVSLLCPTGLDFLLAWIGLLRMGHGVVFIAPQCSSSAIAHLVQSTSSSHLVYHSKYAELAQSSASPGSDYPMVELPSIASTSTAPKSALPTLPDVRPASVSHVFHTSGTSGTPKPIPHTHSHSVSVLPRRALPSYLQPRQHAPAHQPSLPPSESAAFTTTPLFHGGVSDLLRAWMARSAIYFYPTSDVPITERNVVGAVQACQAAPSSLTYHISQAQVEERKHRFTVTAFLSVPYILTILSEDEAGVGMQMLAGLDYVSTGGAPLDTRIGDKMVAKGVNLVSRLGSSECGFLMSSHRDYETEKDWEWLRNDSGYSEALVFEPQERDGKMDDGICEMVVTDRWMSKTKSNRDDGSYATGDLYRRHDTKPNVWRYAGRGDDVVVMSNGEKASPGPIESLLRSSPLLSEALVVGSDQPQLGVLLFSRSSSTSPTEILSQLEPLFHEANAQSPSFAQISKEMCLVVTDPSRLEAMPKSSKGTIQRGVAYQTYKNEIATLYAANATSDEEKEKLSLEQIKEFVRDLITRVAGKKCKVDELDAETDLFSWGVDSLMATRIRGGLQKDLNTGGTKLPTNVVFEKPTISRLSRYIHDLQEKNAAGGEENVHQEMEHLVEKYGNFTASSSSDPAANSDKQGGKTIILTGATGSLGIFILSKLSALPSDIVKKIICLVRAENDDMAAQRVFAMASQRGLKVAQEKVGVYAADLAKDGLGMKGQVYATLRDEVDDIIHAAWPVHFASSLTSFESSVKGTRNLIDLISPIRARLFFCSSLASVLAGPSPITESPTTDPSTASTVGYSQSKWVTERVCALANEKSLGGRAHVLRIGQLCGDTTGGYWNEKEGWPLLIRTAQTTGVLPELDEEPSWLPVDLAAQAIIDVVLPETERSFIYHISHPAVIPWSTILDGLTAANLQFRRVPAQEWLEQVEKTEEEDPSRQMLDMWKAAYAQPSGVDASVVDCSHAVRDSETLRTIAPVGEEHVGRMVEAWRKSGFLR